MIADEFFQRNSELAIEFSRYLLEHPELDGRPAGDAALIFLPEFDRELQEFNLQVAREIQQEGGKVVFVKISRLRPHSTSRLEGVAIERTGRDFPVVEGPRRPGDPAVLVASSRRIRQELGWSPRYGDLGAIIRTAWAWDRRHPQGYADAC